MTGLARIRYNDSAIEIEGNESFVHQVNTALALIHRCHYEAFLIVNEYVSKIRQHKRSGMLEDESIFNLADKSAFYSVTWCAGAIAHDSMHSKLYHDYLRKHGRPVPEKIYGLQIAELRCISHQIEVLGSIGAPSKEIEWCRQQDGLHWDRDGDGDYDWDDYRMIDW